MLNVNLATKEFFHKKPNSKQKSGMDLRYRAGSDGYWVAFLIPIATFLCDFNFQELKRPATLAPVFTFHAFLICFFYWMDINLSILLQRLRKIIFACAFFIMFICFAQNGDMYKWASITALFLAFPYVFYNLMKQYPRSFTFGEGVMVTTAFLYTFWGASQAVPFPPNLIQFQPEPVLVSLFLQGIFFVTMLCGRLFLLLQKPWKLYVLEEMFCLWSKYCIIAFATRIPILNDDAFWFLALWPFKFLVATPLRVSTNMTFCNKTRPVSLITFWAVMSLLTGLFVVYKNRTRTTATTVDRKVFHFLIAVVFFSGIALDRTLIFCCSSVLFYLFLLVETIRVLRLEIFEWKIGKAVDHSVRSFRDHQDEGRLILTPIYLLVGCALPVWLTGLFHNSNNDLKPIQHSACLAGVFSVGIGDTFASIGGTYYGRTPWPNSRKTVEGTVCSIIAQVVAAALIFTIGVVPYTNISVAALIAGIVVNAVTEGNTDQIDNLVLPLVTFIVVHGVGIAFNEND